ncbi:MAG TPA: helix-turn-helix transcriptional regulator [Dehalococcoidia bacterium]|nr:helix-turn-helix transcriptional regulator [Dehalococcoidia bacterium]
MALRTDELAAGCTERELQIARLIALGMSNASIATTLSISENTVRFHLKELYARRGSSSRAGLAASFARCELGTKATRVH